METLLARGQISLCEITFSYEKTRRIYSERTEIFCIQR